MYVFDPRNPPDWVRRLIARAHRRQGRDAEAGATKSEILSLGLGTFVAPLARGWSLHPEQPFSGNLRLENGPALSYRLESYEDPPAARGEARLLDYLDLRALRAQVRSAADAFDRVLVSIPDDPGGQIVWTRLDALAGSHLRELVLRCRVSAAMAPHRAAIARSVAAWLDLGGFAPEATSLDRVAHNAALERLNFQDTLLMRVPRRWTLTTQGKKDGRTLCALHEPQERETLWVSSRHARLPAKADPLDFLAGTVDAIWDGTPAPDRRHLHLRRRETLPGGDVLTITSSEEEENGVAVRRLSWTRYGIRGEHLVWAPVHLVTPMEHVDAPEQVENEALFDREVRNALLLPPPDEAGPADSPPKPSRGRDA